MWNGQTLVEYAYPVPTNGKDAIVAEIKEYLLKNDIDASRAPEGKRSRRKKTHRVHNGVFVIPQNRNAYGAEASLMIRFRPSSMASSIRTAVVS